MMPSKKTGTGGGKALRPAGLLPSRWLLPLRNMIEGGYRMEISLIRERLPRGDKPILDIGSGSGEIDPAALGGHVVALEFDRGLLPRATEKNYYGVVRGDAAELPFGDNVFSAVSACKIAHHLDDAALECMAAETYRVLAPGGRFVLLDPVAPSDKTTFMHNFIAAIEVGAYHRNLAETKEYFMDFVFIEAVFFRKRWFDFYVAVFEKPAEKSST